MTSLVWVSTKATGFSPSGGDRAAVRRHVELQVAELLEPHQAVQVDAARALLDGVERVDERMLARSVVERVGEAPSGLYAA